MNDAFDKRDNVVEKRDEDYPMGMGMGMGMGPYGYGRGMGMGMGMGAGMGVDMDDLMEKREFMQKRAEHESNAADGAGDEANTPDRPGKAPSGLSAEELDDFLTKRQEPRPVVNVGAAHQDKRDTYVTSHHVSPSYGARYTVGNPMYGAAAMGYGMGMMNPDEVYDSID
ncbi:hypothetical protein BC940DRAFT_306533 [Gongronella butleri]|nr:hypothetical protein BC940DRAFT_306533 [Gongronella butleri]